MTPEETASQAKLLRPFWLALSACALSLALVLGSGLLAFWNGSTLDPEASFVIVALTGAAIGGVVAWRRPANPVGWLFLGAALGILLQGFARQWAIYALITEPGALPFARLAAWIAIWTGPLGAALMFIILPLYFPDGRPISPRWRFVGRLVALALVAHLSILSLAPNRVVYGTEIANPLGIEALPSVLGWLEAAGFVQWLGLILVAVASLVARFRRSEREERQQLKWFMYAVSAVLVWFCVNWPIEDAIPRVFPFLDALVISGVPVAAGVAVLKYRLYDIDVVINRTLVYGTLTATLVAAYAGGVISLQYLFRALTGQESQLAVVASTLTIAALSGPLRRRIQGVIDRRFYRRKYDAATTLAAFSARLRDEVDLETLCEDLLGVLHETIQPAHASLWLRPVNRGEKEEQ